MFGCFDPLHVIAVEPAKQRAESTKKPRQRRNLVIEGLRQDCELRLEVGVILHDPFDEAPIWRAELMLSKEYAS